MKSPLYLFEHRAKPFPWTQAELAALDRLNRSASTEILRPTVRAGKPHLQAREHVGVIRFGKHTVQVLPKIHRVNEDVEEEEQIREATRNLLYLLAFAGQFPVRAQNIAPLLKRNLDWFEILTRLFATNLLVEWRRGAHRGYEILEENLPTLKGKWRIADQLRRPLHKHAFEISYDEFTADNRLNQVFNYVVHRLRRLTHDQENSHLLGILTQAMSDIHLPARISPAHLERVHLTRLNRRFEPLLNLARLFIDNSALQLSSGNEKTFCFVFDMNALYEAFVVNFIRRHRDAILPPHLERSEILPQTRGGTLHLAQHHGRPVFRMKPDISFRLGDSFLLILDTKYKILSSRDARLGVAQSDFYQMYAYSQRYDCPQVILLYPQTAEMHEPISEIYTLEEDTKAIRVETLDIRVDLSSRGGISHIKNQLRNMLEVQGEYRELAP